MEKIIVENRTDLSWQYVLSYISTVIAEGKISKTSKGPQYCFVTTFQLKNRVVHVVADKNKLSDRFVVYEG